MLGSLVNSFGLGVLLSATNRMSPGLDAAARSYINLNKISAETADKIRGHMTTITNAVEDFRHKARLGLTFMGVGAAMLTPFAIAAKLASDSEDRMNSVKSLLVGTGMASGLASQQVAMLGKSILNMAKLTRVPLKETEEAAYDLVSANLTVNEAMGVLPTTAKLAVAGLGTMKEATQVMASDLNTFGRTWGDSMTPMEKGNKIAQAYAGTIAALKTTLPQMAQAMSAVSGTANTLGASIEETTVLTAFLMTQGLEAGRSGFAANAMFRELLNLSNKPQQDQGPLAGLMLADAQGRLRPIADIIADIERSMKGMESVKAGQLLGRAFGDEGKRAIELLFGQSAAYRDLVEQVRTKQRLDEMVAARQAGLGANWDIFKNVIHAQAITIGQWLLPSLNQFLMMMTQVIDRVRQFTDEHPNLTRLFLVFGVGTGLLLATAGASYVLVAGWQALMTIGGALRAVLGLVMAAEAGTAAATWALLWPILAVIAAVGVLIFALDKLAGTNVTGSIWDFVTGKNFQPNLQLAGAGGQPTGLTLPTSYTPPAIPQASARGSESAGGGNTYVTNYGSTKIPVTVHGTQGMNVDDLAGKTGISVAKAVGGRS